MDPAISRSRAEQVCLSLVDVEEVQLHLDAILLGGMTGGTYGYW